MVMSKINVVLSWKRIWISIVAGIHSFSLLFGPPFPRCAAAWVSVEVFE